MNANVFISVTGNGLARAERGKNSEWQVEYSLTSRDIRCLAADPHHPHILYAGTQGQGVLRSQDAGKSWHLAGLVSRIVKSVAVSAFPARNSIGPGIVFAGTKSPPSIFVSEDGGENWTECEAFRRIRSRWFWFSPAEPPFTAYVQGIALSPTDSSVILAGIEAGAVVRSQDGGKTWSDHRPGAVRDCHTLTFNATNGDWSYEGGGGGGAISRDGGKTWRQPRDGLDRRYGWAVAADPAHPEVWYLSASPALTKLIARETLRLISFALSAERPGKSSQAAYPSRLIPCRMLCSPTEPPPGTYMPG